MGKRTLEETVIAYVVWTLIALLVLFVFDVINNPSLLVLIVIVCVLKDIADIYNIKIGSTSFLHPYYFEHLPFVVLIAYYGSTGAYSFAPYEWITIVALIDALVDFAQDIRF